MRFCGETFRRCIAGGREVETSNYYSGLIIVNMVRIVHSFCSGRASATSYRNSTTDPLLATTPDVLIHFKCDRPIASPDLGLRAWLHKVPGATIGIAMSSYHRVDFAGIIVQDGSYSQLPTGGNTHPCTKTPCYIGACNTKLREEI